MLSVGIILFIVARSRKSMWWFLAVSFVPLVSGILTMYFHNRILDREWACLEVSHPKQLLKAGEML